MSTQTRTYYTPEDLERMLRISRRTLDRMSKAGKMPQPTRLSAKLIRWEASAIDAWLAERQAVATPA